MLNNEIDSGSPLPWGAGYNSSGVSWGAILAGAAAAAALSLILVILGSGLGFSAISPWPSSGASATTVGVSAAIWLALTQIVAAGLGGYLAGRLRVKWADVQTDEIYFRDTAHGMLAWAVATLVTAAFLGSVLAGVVGAGAKAAGGIASSAAPIAQSAASSAAKDGNSGGLSYYVDSLFRSDQTGAADPGQPRAQSEAATILVRSIAVGKLDAQDKTYLSKLVARHTGLNQADAEKRVDDLYAQAQQSIEQAKTKAKEAADAARKAAATAALWTFVALLCGAFFASLAAIWGGRRRDMAVIVASRASAV
jgi:hypothetical protein